MYKKFILSIIQTLIIVSGFSQTQFDGLKSINGTEIYCKIIGKGDPILIIHGGPGLNQEYLLPHLEALTKKHTLIFYDQRSSGKSALSIQQFMNFKQFAADIDSLRSLLGFEQITVFGHSWGGLLATYYTIHFPEHVRKLILCNTVPFDHSFDFAMHNNQLTKTTLQDSVRLNTLVQSDAFRKGEISAINEVMLLTFKTTLFDTLNFSKLDFHLPENYSFAALSYFGFAKELREYNFFPMLDAIQVPVLIIHGIADNIPLASDEKIHTSLKNSTLIIFNYSGQFPFIEENKRFIKQINKFLK